jgi:very-short-patch-repair endonuclease
VDDKVRVYHLTELRNRRRDLRQKSTMTERLLWEKLRSNRLGMKFRRQFSVKGYVVDFYCSKARLAIELLGGVHKNIEAIKHDVYRKKYLESFWITVLEFENEEVEKDIVSVIEKINRCLNQQPHL